jgi:hypothetical protein
MHTMHEHGLLVIVQVSCKMLDKVCDKAQLLTYHLLLCGHLAHRKLWPQPGGAADV